MLVGGIFSKAVAWIGVAGFGFLTLFTIVATFVPSLYTMAFYGFGSIGGMLALAWFYLVARKFLQMAKTC